MGLDKIMEKLCPQGHWVNMAEYNQLNGGYICYCCNEGGRGTSIPANDLREPLFVYGTLRDKETQLKVIGRTFTDLRKVRLKNFIKTFIEVEGITHQAIVHSKDSGSIIEGLILDVTQDELKKIDEHETNAYNRVVVCLTNSKRVWVYRESP